MTGGILVGKWGRPLSPTTTIEGHTNNYTALVKEEIWGDRGVGPLRGVEKKRTGRGKIGHELAAKNTALVIQNTFISCLYLVW